MKESVIRAIRQRALELHAAGQSGRYDWYLVNPKDVWRSLEREGHPAALHVARYCSGDPYQAIKPFVPRADLAEDLVCYEETRRILPADLRDEKKLRPVLPGLEAVRQKDWSLRDPDGLRRTLRALEAIRDLAAHLQAVKRRGR